MKRHSLPVSTVLMLAASAAWGAGVGTSAAPFLKLGMGARAQGMAGAFSALADDPTAVHWNPAGLVASQKPQLHVDFIRHFQDVRIGQAAYSRKSGSSAYGLGMTYLRVEDIERRGLTDVAGVVPSAGSFAATDLAVTASYARAGVLPDVVENIDAGVSVKVIRSAIDDEEATAFAADAGLLYRASDKLRLSLVLANLGTEMKFREEGDPLPLALRAGAAYKASGSTNLTAELDEQITDQKLYAAVGAEHWLRGAMALRGGYRFGYDTSNLGSEAGLALGVGVKVAGLGLDYAFLPFGDLGESHRFGFWIQF